MALSISVPQVRQHEAFLVRVHDNPFNSGGRLYSDRAVLTAAVVVITNMLITVVINQ